MNRKSNTDQSMPPSLTGGGAATHSGTDYQNRVAAWIAVRILAEQSATPPWNLSSSTSLTFLQCETLEPVDDILVGTSASGHVFVQAKHTIDCGATDTSEFASVIDQFVRQYHERIVQGQKSSWDRPLDAQTDRLVLVTSPSASSRIRVTLPDILERLSGLAPLQAIESAAVSADEKAVLTILLGHVSQSWLKLKQASPSSAELQAFAKLVRVHVLDVDADKAQEDEAKNLIRTTVIKGPNLTDQAWNCLIQTCAIYAAQRNGATRQGLQEVLIAAGIDLEPIRSYRQDIEKLTCWSKRSIASLASLSAIRVTAAQVVKLSRDSTVALERAALSGSLVVVGQPGAGKSGALFDLATHLQKAGDVLVFAVGLFEAGSLGGLRNEIGSAHEIEEILGNWPSTKPGFLIIDALDAARTSAGAKAFRDLIGAVIASNSRWRVIASIRKFDLRYSASLHGLFPGPPPTVYQDPEFKTLRHIEIPVLSDAELKQASSQSAELGAIIQNAGPELGKLLRIPFNLRLVAELLGTGVNTAVLSPIRTQIELLERYWSERVIASDTQADAREAVLRLATTEMVQDRSLRIDRAVLASNPAASAPLHQVLSAQVLVEWQPSPETTPERYILTYAHHILFDYAVARLLIRGPQDQVIARLSSEPDLLLAVRPSLLYHFQYLWNLDQNHQRFWHSVFGFFAAAGITQTGKIIGPIVAVQMITRLADCDILIRTLKDEQNVFHKVSQEVFRHLVGAAHSGHADIPRPISGSNAGLWCELLEKVSEI